MMRTVNGRDFNLRELYPDRVFLPTIIEDEARKRMIASLNVVQRVIEKEEAIYGVTTGFGDLCDITIPAEQLRELQVNLVRSHACAVGEPLSPEITAAMMLARANALAVGASGIRPDVVTHILTMLQHRIIPVVPRIGSLGASGDLAPLAHAAMGMIGEGMVDVWQDNKWKRISAEMALAEAGIKPLLLGPKEGLSLLNGTSLQIAYSAHISQSLDRLLAASDVALTMSLSALGGSLDPFLAELHALRRQPGQEETSSLVRSLLQGNAEPAYVSSGRRVQEPYSIRCAPQVHGACRSAFKRLKEVAIDDLNSATDNPLVITTEDGERIVSGGHFHGEPIGIVLDQVAIAIAELGSISERRTDLLLTENSTGLPSFLTEQPGLESGMMIPHYVAAAALSELQIHAAPASIHSTPTSGGQEDHVSNAATAGWKAHAGVSKLAGIIAVELMTGSKALDMQGVQVPAPLQQILDVIRHHAPVTRSDTSLSDPINELARALLSGSLESVLP
ncbi:MAG: histidine ammonia-lyase [Euryarchaeota archaeon]|nr:histidine ammonia-lyase [Euryarchaeota archaeon]